MIETERTISDSLNTLSPATPSKTFPTVLGMRVDATNYAEATQTVCDWAEQGEARHVCVANVHMVMEAWDDSGLRAIVNAADLVAPDGMPLVWVLRCKGFVLEMHRVGALRLASGCGLGMVDFRRSLKSDDR